MQYLLWCIRENHSIWLGLLSNGCFFSTQQWDSTLCSMWTKCFFSVDSASAIRGRTWAIKEPHYEMTWNTVMRHRYIYILKHVIVMDLGHIHSHSHLVLPATFFSWLQLYISRLFSLATILNHYGKEDYICSNIGGYYNSLFHLELWLIQSDARRLYNSVSA